MTPIVDLTNKKFIITGASSGIGRQTAITVSRLGGIAICIARRENELKETLSLLEGTGHAYYVFDLSETSNIEELFKQIKATHGLFDGMCYAAGIAKDSPLNMASTQRLKSTFDINYYGFIECARCFCKRGFYNEGSSIVAISSVCSMVGSMGHLPYSSSKASMDVAIKCMAVEVASKTIRVNAINPGMIDTDIWKSLLTGAGGEDADVVKRFMERQYLGIGHVGDISNMAAFLLSSAAKFITGTCIPVDGGYSSN